MAFKKTKELKNVPRIFISSLGCPKNLADAEVMAGELAGAGWEVVSDEAEADAALVNTCAFLGSAVKESEAEIRRLLALKKLGRLKKVIIAGCLTERMKGALLDKFPEADAAIGVGALKDAVRALEEGGLRLGDTMRHGVPFLEAPPLKLRLTAPHSAYLKVADGCDNRCAYCLIPSLRGPFRSKPLEAAVEEARLLAASGAKEISLIAQDTTLYGADLYGKPALGRLLRKISAIKGLRWIRVMYAYPERVTPELLRAMAGAENICRYLDLPLQHASDAVLKAMNRRSTEKSLRRTLSSIRRLLPGAAIRTNFIVGFPGETDKDFARLLRFVRDERLDNVGVFKYSREPGTSAAGFPGQVPDKVKTARMNELLAAQAAGVDSINAGLVGKKLEVLMDSPRFGRTYRDAPGIDGTVEVSAPGDTMQQGVPKPRPGDFVKVRITSARGYSRKGILL
ncbi:MAG: MiaB family RNA modification protein [Elusimicrobia bacterium]|nr:MAG: MiaB family RNA modification protein [Elusimicrobiota bacterium]KAF0153805.1 MAG: MiaB family RNA modification protein [Elusimicrobiota bacterium]